MAVSMINLFLCSSSQRLADEGLHLLPTRGLPPRRATKVPVVPDLRIVHNRRDITRAAAGIGRPFRRCYLNDNPWAMSKPSLLPGITRLLPVMNVYENGRSIGAADVLGLHGRE